MDNQSGQDSSWGGFLLTGTLWIISSLTLSDVAMICTAIAGITTALYNAYRYFKERKNK